MDHKANYNAWNIKESEFPKDRSVEEKIQFFIKYGVLAPSTHNTQPWQFKIVGSKLLILPDWDYKLPYGDPDNSNLYFSLGCCAVNILSAAEYFGLSTIITISNSVNKPIEINFKNKIKSDIFLRNLFPYITKRFSNKFQYNNTDFESSIKKGLFTFSNNDEAKLIFVYDKKITTQIAEIHKNAVLSYLKNKKFKSELASWMRTNNTKSYDGMPGFVSGLSNMKVKIGKILLRYTPIIIKSHGKKDKVLISTSPMVGVIYTKSNKISDWVKSGMLYEKIALFTTSKNIQTTILAAMIEDQYSNSKLKKLLNLNGYLQIFFRLGVNDINNIHTPRRSPQYVS